MARFSFQKEKIKILLLEGIDPKAAAVFTEQGYPDVEILPGALNPSQLIEKLKDVYILGIRSRTLVNKKVLENAPKLFALGCYCIGTDQVDLKAAALEGIPVFNAPHSNTRSVAELVIGLTVMLMRQVFEKNAAAHQGIWLKSAAGCHEVRGKKMGIIGYGHIGSQVSVLAESLGMQVYYYDIQSKLPLGNAKSLGTIEELFQIADIVTLHVPDTPQTKNMMGLHEFRQMRREAFLINASRGTVVDIDALAEALDAKMICGAAVDVFPKEPSGSQIEFETPLRGKKGVILTPHIGGSTEEAQHNIGTEVSKKLIHYSDRGSTEGATNFPVLNLAQQRNTHRILHIHRNIPGMLQKINQAIADEGINVQSQYLLTTEEIGYVVLDIEMRASKKLIETLQEIKGTIRSRLLY